MTDDYYNILGIQSDATSDEIRKAYLKLASIHHPDKHINEIDKQKAHKKFILIGTAYEILSNELSRDQYNFYSKNKPNSDTHKRTFNFEKTSMDGAKFNFASPFNQNNNAFKHFENLFKEHTKMFGVANNEKCTTICRREFTSKIIKKRNQNVTIEKIITEDERGNVIETTRTIYPKMIGINHKKQI